MIQRIQTLYLFLIFAIALLLMLSNPIYAEFRMKHGFNPESVLMQYWSQFSISTESRIPVYSYKLLNMILLVLVGMGSLANVFLYGNRKLQLKFVGILVLCAFVFFAILLVDYFMTKSQFENNSISTTLGYQIVWPLLMLVFSILAYLGIRHDERLVQSMDRIR
jgi:MFS family permease